MNESDNAYLNAVVEQQQRVERELWRGPAGAADAAPAAAPGAARTRVEFRKGLLSPPDEPGPARLPDYRITGNLLIGRTVVVAPNVYAVHTRRGHAEPLHVGQGLSFDYNPKTDAFLIVPAAVQTLLINARCICAERQGVLVQAYLQWVIDDIRTAYRRLDFSDPADPMRVVNVQLREQAEAAIKDKVATMPIDAVLSDKQPIIEELTHRLRAVAEGSRDGTASGLGLKIVTVQIKEAVVSSTRLWENLQKPFRAEREKLARLAELDAQKEVATREILDRQERERAEFEYQRRQAQARADLEREQYDRERAEQARRHQLEQQAEQRAIAERTATAKAQREAELELALQELELDQRRLASELEAVRRQGELERARADLERQRAEAAATVAGLTHHAEAERRERDLALDRLRRTVENEVTPGYLQAQLIRRLPEIAAALPKPDELRTVNIAGGAADGPAALLGFLAGALQLAHGGRNGADAPGGEKDPPGPASTE